MVGRTEELENYFLILAAFEDNLAQYMKIKNQLVEVFGCICDLHKRARLEGALRDGEGNYTGGNTGTDQFFNVRSRINLMF